jgi:hypothetical protein
MAVSQPDLWTLRRADSILQEYVKRNIVLQSDDDLGVTRRLFDSCTNLLLLAQGDNEHFREAQKLLERSRPKVEPQLAMEFGKEPLPFPKGRGSGWGTT